MNKNQQRMVVAGAAGGLVLVVLVVVWRVSASRAEDRAAELVSATADMVRCMAGDDVKLEKAQVHQGFERRMVLDLPDINTAKPCTLALDVVKEKWDAYGSVWFNSAGSKGDDGAAYGDRFERAYDQFRALPLDKSSDQVFLRKEKYGSVLGAGELVFEMHDAARSMYARDGASEDEVAKANENRMRKAPNVPDRAPRGRVVATIPGKVKPVDWKVSPSGKGLLLHALNDAGEMVVAWTDDGTAWKSAKGPGGFGGKKALELRAIDAPNGERWFLVAHGEKEGAQVHVGKVGEGTLPAPLLLPPPPAEWKRAPGGEREAVVLAKGVKAFPVWRIVEKTDDEKKAEKKEREEWDKNFADKDVQALITLAEQRRAARAALGIDDDHKRMDGIAYVVGDKEVSVLELPGYGLAGLVPGAEPMALVGEGSLPAQKMASFTVPPVGEPIGMTAVAVVVKPVEPALRGSPWFRCLSSDGTYWGTTTTGSFLIGMQPGSLQLVQMTALADEGSHIGCGPNVATVALPFMKDRIFANVLTVRGGEIEGAKIHTTAGTDIDTYNRTSSTGAATGAVVLGWVARGYALYTVNIKTDNEFMAPRFLAEVGTDGSTISGVHFVGVDKRMIGVVAREACAGTSCTTSFEIVVSDDDARTWTVPG